MFEPIAHELPLRDRVVQEILGKIQAGVLAPGDRLPPERELAQQLHVSRTTVRDALRTLAGLGVVAIHHGRGIFVVGSEGLALGSALWAPFVVRKDTVTALFEVRRTLEVAAAGWAAARATPAERQHLTDIVARALSAVEGDSLLDIDAVADADQRFHTALVLASHNPIAGRLMLNLLDVLEIVRKQSLAIPGRARRSLEDHRAIAEAVARGDARAAERAARDHLASVEASILRHLLPSS